MFLILIFVSCNFEVSNDDNLSVEERVEKNYSEEIDEFSEHFVLDKNYLKALAVLECAGRKLVKPRFEKATYKTLKKLRSGKIDKFENITTEMLEDISDDELKDMASSWGAFQIMGYKCFWLGVDIEDIKGDMNLYYASEWIDKTYGKYVRAEQYKHAFHLHNTGKLYPDSTAPTTHNPNYVENGLKYIEIFKKIDSISEIEVTDTVIIKID